jgi:hypothetical protein
MESSLRSATISDRRWKFLPWIALLTAAPFTLARADEAPDGAISYSQQIRGILSDNCYQCHGPDAAQRKAGLRLDRRESAIGALDSGVTAIVPGKPEASELARRISSDDESFRMPPPEANKNLTRAEKELLVAWIAQGADFEQLWSFVPPVRPELPQVKRTEWPQTPIDHFVLAKLEGEGLQPAPKAGREALIRRLSFDLTGLPPTLAEIDAFLADASDDAYEKVVDRLLASPHFGERLALDWLDAARFADTNGYHLDNGRDMSHWRAWVIQAMNDNMPFDQFTIEQLAGDLLPDATLEQQIASGFNRNHMINFEGGAIPAEYHNAYIVDRVNTTATVWLGLTVACAQCHDHKFDPITQKEFYQLYAFFNNVPEKGLDGNQGNAAPMVQLPTPEQTARLKELEDRIAELTSHKEGSVETDKSSDGSAEESGEGNSEELAGLRKERNELKRQIPTSMVMAEMDTPRETFLLVRGQYDSRGEQVFAGMPASLPSLPDGAPANRLTLARWLVSPDHPLTARVTVNRYWQMFFGTGIVRTAEDFGSQGEFPSHPELLDWLAVEFVESGWDIKHMLRLIVTSSTYRQSAECGVRNTELKNIGLHASSTPHSELRIPNSDTPHSVDPENRLLSRGPRFRLPAEMIRDQALAVSGLLKHKIGGPSVSPYQPAGLWQELSSRGDSSNWTAQVFELSEGNDLYRRSMYTFWKRTSPPPQMVALDAPDRETCTVRRARTNTPLQALILMNDPTYVEASRKLAERMLTECGTNDEERLSFAFRLATARLPSAAELEVLRTVLDQQRLLYRDDPDAARALMEIGEADVADDLDVQELAAWTMVASAILNLDETLTKG